MSSQSTDPIARAFELARSGNHRTVEDIRRTLTRERYQNVAGHLSGTLIKSQLRKAILAGDPPPDQPAGS